MTDRPNTAAYVTSKSGLEGFADVMRMELEGTGVRVGIVRPGPSSTEQGTTWTEDEVNTVVAAWDHWACCATAGRCARSTSRRPSARWCRRRAARTSPCSKSSPKHPAPRIHHDRTPQGLRRHRRHRPPRRAPPRPHRAHAPGARGVRRRRRVPAGRQGRRAAHRRRGQRGLLPRLRRGPRPGRRLPVHDADLRRGRGVRRPARAAPRDAPQPGAARQVHAGPRRDHRRARWRAWSTGGATRARSTSSTGWPS